MSSKNLNKMKKCELIQYINNLEKEKENENKNTDLENKSSEELFDLLENLDDNEDELIENYCMNTYTYWEKEFYMRDSATITFRYLNPKEDGIECEVYYKPNGEEKQLIQNHKSNLNPIIVYEIYMKNDDIFLVEPNSYQEEIIKKIMDNDDYDYDMLNLSVDMVYECFLT